MLGRYVWLDLELTGLDKDQCKICEIAAIITDPYSLKELGSFHKVVDARTAYWEHPALEMHLNNGLYQAMSKGKDLDEAVKDFVDWLETFAGYDSSGNRIPFHLAGSTVYFDRDRLAKVMGEEHYRSLFSHRVVDVSSIKLEVIANCGEDIANEHKHSSASLEKAEHRAMADIKFSLNELRFFRSKGLIGGVKDDTTT